MFNLAEFVKKNLVSGHLNGIFSEEQVNIYAANYMIKGVLSEQDVIDITAAIQPHVASG